MDRHEKVVEAKLMAIEEVLVDVKHDEDGASTYEYAQRILDAIRGVEIEDEVKRHEASLEEASRNKPE